MCNIFYIVNNFNFNEHFKDDQDEDKNIIYCNKFITNKLNCIKTLENKLLKIMGANAKDALITDLNNKILELRATMEKTIDTHVKDANYNINMLNNIHVLLDTY